MLYKLLYKPLILVYVYMCQTGVRWRKRFTPILALGQHLKITIQHCQPFVSSFFLGHTAVWYWEIKTTMCQTGVRWWKRFTPILALGQHLKITIQHCQRFASSFFLGHTVSVWYWEIKTTNTIVFFYFYLVVPFQRLLLYSVLNQLIVHLHKAWIGKGVNFA